MAKPTSSSHIFFEETRGRITGFKRWISPAFPNNFNLSSSRSQSMGGVKPIDTTIDIVKLNLPPVYRPFRRLRYRRHVYQHVPEEEMTPEIVAQLEWKGSELIFLVAFGWWVLHPLLVFLYILLGFGCATKPENDESHSFYNPELLPAKPEKVTELMDEEESFVFVEGPRGTGMTTLLKEASRLVISPLFMTVQHDAKNNGGSMSNSVYYYVAHQLYITEFQARCILWALQLVGRPAHLFFDVNSVNFDLALHCKDIKSLVVDTPTIRAVVASSDGNAGGIFDPMISKISLKEMTIPQARTFLVAYGIQDSAELDLEALLKKYPRTPLHLRHNLLPRLGCAKEAEAFVEKEVANVRVHVESVFTTCKHKDKFTELVTKQREITWDDIQKLCGNNFDQTNFEENAVQHSPLFSRDDKAFVDATQESELFTTRRQASSVTYLPQFDQTVEAFRRAKF